LRKAAQEQAQALTPDRSGTVRDDSICDPVEGASGGRGGPGVDLGALGLGREGVQLPVPIQVELRLTRRQALHAVGSHSKHLSIMYCIPWRYVGDSGHHTQANTVRILSDFA